MEVKRPQNTRPPPGTEMGYVRGGEKETKSIGVKMRRK
jgi:hypothetical protein